MAFFAHLFGHGNPFIRRYGCQYGQDYQSNSFSVFLVTRRSATAPITFLTGTTTCWPQASCRSLRTTRVTVGRHPPLYTQLAFSWQTTITYPAAAVPVGDTEATTGTSFHRGYQPRLTPHRGILVLPRKRVLQGYCVITGQNIYPIWSKLFTWMEWVR